MGDEKTILHTNEMMSRLLLHILVVIIISVNSQELQQGTKVPFKDYQVLTSRRGWLRSETGCAEVKDINDLPKTCVEKSDGITCTLKSPTFGFNDFPGEKINIQVTNSEGIIDCKNCNDNFEGKLTIKQDGDNARTFTINGNIGENSYDKIKNSQSIEFSLELISVCKSDIKIAISHFECNPIQTNLVNYPTTIAPNSTENVKNVTGVCAVNTVAINENVPFMDCYSDGRYRVSGECVCDVGYEKVDDKCQACDNAFFKLKLGNHKCTKCGDNSVFSGTECVCNEGFARLIEDKGNHDAHCQRLPSKPANFLSRNVTQTSVYLNWENDSEFNGKYILHCSKCPQSEKDRTVTMSSISYTGLRPNNAYEITIRKEDIVTAGTGSVVEQKFTFKTDIKVPGKVSILTIKNVEKGKKGKGVNLHLTEMSEKDFGTPVTYVIEFKNGTLVKQQSSFVFISTNNEEAVIEIKIYAEIKDTDGNDHKGRVSEYQVDVPAIQQGNKVDNTRSDLSLIIGGAVGGIMFVMIILIVILLIRKHRKPKQFEVSRMEDGTMTIPRSTLFRSNNYFVDPTTYSHVDEAVEEFVLELNRSSVSMDHILGGGEFANVFKGIMSTESRNSDIAIKVLKSGACRSDRDDFLSEAAILGQFSDPNVITIEGVILKDHPHLIVLEYMENGSLDKYLVKNDSQFSIQKLLGMARGVSSGMKYLSDLGYIHRDLAARNVLVNTDDVCKIADFGMSRELKTDDTYDTRGGKIPIKWTAPEAIEFKKFTTASDVWSYGILLWEIFSYGERPYWEWSNLEVIERLSTGYRLPPPMNCPKVIHDMMLQCWHKDRLKRPRFPNILEKLEEWLKNPSLLTEIASVITKRDEDLDYSILEDLASWLEAINMSQYLKMFTESGYMTPKDVLYLTNEDLEGLGVGLIGHRKKLLKAIKNTKNQTEGDIRKISSSTTTTEKSNKVGRSTSFAGFGTALSKKVSFLASPNSSMVFKKTIGKRPSLGYKLQNV